MKLKSLILTIGFLILTFIFISCSSQENNNKNLQESFIEPPEKIMVYKNNEQIVIEKNFELYTKIVELANDRIKEPLNIAKLAFEDSSLKTIKSNETAVEFFYSEKVSSEFKSDNDKVLKKEYSRLLMLLTGDNKELLIFGDDGRYHDGPYGRLLPADDLLNLVTQIPESNSLTKKQNEGNLTETTKGISEKDIKEEKQIEMAISMAQKFCDDMTKSWLKLERVDMSDYLVDNVNTHLVLNWIDFDIADRKQNTWKQLKSIDKVLLNSGNFERISETQITYKTFVEIGYTRHEPSVIGIGINLTLNLEMVDGKWMITGADILGPSIYREWKESNYTTIEEMDEAFRNSCKEKGILVNIHKSTISEKGY